MILALLTAVPGAAAAGSPLLDAPAILQQSPSTIQTVLGRPVGSRTVAPGDVHLPGGGTARAYVGRGMRIDVDFERERSTTVVIAFPDATLAPRSYEAALEAVNLPAGPRPDLVRHDRREWRSLEGYFVQVIAAYPALDRIDAIILSARPLP